MVQPVSRPAAGLQNGQLRGQLYGQLGVPRHVRCDPAIGGEGVVVREKPAIHSRQEKNTPCTHCQAR